MTKSDLPIRYYGHPDLRVKAKPVEKITPEIIKICESMLAKMISLDNCIGFAGPQLGILLRIFVIREEIFLPDDKYALGDPEVIINPVLSSPSKELESMAEGCMSLPGLHVDVVRPKSIHVRYQNLKGEFVEEDLTDFRARMFMHENDHLNGVLHIDRMDPKERKKIEKILRDMKQKYNP
ncbi:MAG: peptide deformylase [Chlamydiae bacterium CG10_big_fil_rev_8_21_14_0_10_42_34]|nr:MAG: peptide deformylase [Chlamydiae bacterium CG10_big_fil_rev_8_21_14_0_10_42_34]